MPFSRISFEETTKMGWRNNGGGWVGWRKNGRSGNEETRKRQIPNYILSKCYLKWTPNNNAAWATWLKLFGVEPHFKDFRSCERSELWDDTLVTRHVRLREFLWNSIPIQMEGMNCNSIQNRFKWRRLETSKIVTCKTTNLWKYLLVRFRP